MEARDGWYRFAEEHDTNATALLEAIGQQLAGLADTPTGKLPTSLKEAVRKAQAVAGQRSTHRRPQPHDD